jgi:pre-rRNA-processing protein TSR3
MAGNPTNFGVLTRLTTVEALAAALIIAGFEGEARSLLSIFGWGHTFLELNQEMLEEYAKAKDSTEVVNLQEGFIKKLHG